MLNKKPIKIRRTWTRNPKTQIIENKHIQLPICDYCDFKDTEQCDKCTLGGA